MAVTKVTGTSPAESAQEPRICLASIRGRTRASARRAREPDATVEHVLEVHHLELLVERPKLRRGRSFDFFLLPAASSKNTWRDLRGSSLLITSVVCCQSKPALASKGSIGTSVPRSSRDAP
jgi:hypothetical protein